VLKARENIPKLLGSKTPLGEYSRDIIRSAGMGFGGPEMIRALLDISNKAAADGQDDLCSTTMDISELVSEPLANNYNSLLLYLSIFSFFFLF
jgi:hypothetical protein